MTAIRPETFSASIRPPMFVITTDDGSFNRDLACDVVIARVHLRTFISLIRASSNV